VKHDISAWQYLAKAVCSESPHHKRNIKESNFPPVRAALERGLHFLEGTSYELHDR
jgi:hypothetical protein|tara:strand:- start:3753 stop:3920 length:168 start_codon:yes stop_codon:yes gene_type:complete